MNTEALILFLIILLGLVLCSFLGGNCYTEGFTDRKYTNTQTTGMNYSPIETVTEMNPNPKPRKNYDNYNHYDQSSTDLVEGTVFYGPNGGTVSVKTNSDGTQSLEITSANGEEPEIFVLDSTTTSTTVESMTTYTGVRGDAVVFRGPNNATATVIYTNDGQQAIRVRTNNGTVTYTSSGTTVYNPDVNTVGYNDPGYNYNNPPGTVGPSNPPGYNNAPGTAGPYNPPGYNNPPGTAGPYNPPGYNNAPGTAGPYNPPGVDKTYYDSLPPGVPRSQIPPGQEDLYILKSQVVPPVCPACPTNCSLLDDNSKCPPCPACERCPEPSFECKKVPSYSGINSYLPVPVLSDFSTFGM